MEGFWFRDPFLSSKIHSKYGVCFQPEPQLLGIWTLQDVGPKAQLCTKQCMKPTLGPVTCRSRLRLQLPTIVGGMSRRDAHGPDTKQHRPEVALCM